MHEPEYTGVKQDIEKAFKIADDADMKDKEIEQEEKPAETEEETKQRENQEKERVKETRI